MPKFLATKKNRIIAISFAFFGILLGIGAFIGVSLIHQHNQKQKTLNEAAASESKSNVGPSTPSISNGKNYPSPQVITIESTRSPMIVSMTGTPSDEIVSVSSDAPSTRPTDGPSTTVSPTGIANRTTLVGEVTTFYAIGDVPYNDQQMIDLKQQILTIPDDAEFVIHVGDMRFGKRSEPCPESDYTDVSTILRLSKKPVFIVIGDNDWNDCMNYDQAIGFWDQEFQHFDSRYWNHTFNVTHQPGRPSNFAFVHKTTLFVGLNIVGGNARNKTEWDERLSDEANWVIELTRDLLQIVLPSTPRIVIFGHANPKQHHGKFFDPISEFIQNELNNKVPVLYLCGDRHRWLHQRNYFDQSSFTRIMLTGKTVDPPLKVLVNGNGLNDPYAFTYDRMLPPGHPSLNGTILDDDEYSDFDDDSVLNSDDAFAIVTPTGTSSAISPSPVTSTISNDSPTPTSSTNMTNTTTRTRWLF